MCLCVFACVYVCVCLSECVRLCEAVSVALGVNRIRYHSLNAKRSSTPSSPQRQRESPMLGAESSGGLEAAAAFGVYGSFG